MFGTGREKTSRQSTLCTEWMIGRRTDREHLCTHRSRNRLSACAVSCATVTRTTYNHSIFIRYVRIHTRALLKTEEEDQTEKDFFAHRYCMHAYTRACNHDRNPVIFWGEKKEKMWWYIFLSSHVVVHIPSRYVRSSPFSLASLSSPSFPLLIMYARSQHYYFFTPRNKNLSRPQ